MPSQHPRNVQAAPCWCLLASTGPARNYGGRYMMLPDLLSIRRHRLGKAPYSSRANCSTGISRRNQPIRMPISNTTRRVLLGGLSTNTINRVNNVLSALEILDEAGSRSLEGESPLPRSSAPSSSCGFLPKPTTTATPHHLKQKKKKKKIRACPSCSSYPRYRRVKPSCPDQR